MFRVTSWTDIPIIIMLLLGVTLYSPWIQAADQYIPIDSYVDQHPEQRAVMDAFAKIVRTAAQPVTIASQRSVRIAIIYPSIQASDYWRRSVVSFERRLLALQLPYQLKLFSSSPVIDSALQSQQLSEALQWQPDYLVFTLDIASQGRMIERLMSRGKPKIILQNITTPLQRWQTHRPFMYVGFDHQKGSELIAKQMLEQIDHQGKYLLLNHSPGYVSQMRGGTFVREAAKYPDVIEVGTYYTDNNKEKSYQATLNAVQKDPDLKMIFACSTDIALGALQALRETDRLDILLNGWGGGDAELKALKQGLDLTIMRINDDNGIAMAEAIKLDQLNQGARIPDIFSGDMALLDNRTSGSEINRLKQKAFRLSGLPGDIY